MKRAEVVQLVMMLKAAFPHRDIPEATLRIYEERLSDLDAGIARKAVAQLMDTCKFLPSIAEIREAATSLRLGPVRSGVEAWADVTSEIRRVGTYSAPAFDDPVVADIVHRWGWVQLCNNDSDATRARFIEMYEAVAARERTNATTTVQLPAPPGTRRLT